MVMPDYIQKNVTAARRKRATWSIWLHTWRNQWLNPKKRRQLSRRKM